MGLKVILKLFIALVALGVCQGALFSIANLCCSTGVQWAKQNSGQCDEYPFENGRLLNVDGISESDQMSCRATIEVCCLQTKEKEYCETGKQVAKQQESCEDLRRTTEDGGDKQLECCGCCKLGLVANREGLACEMTVFGEEFGETCSKTFQECCQGHATNRTVSQEGGDSGSNTGESQEEGYCERYPNQLCEQVCENKPEDPQKFQCSCNQGYKLHSNRRNCVQDSSSVDESSCSINNPCEQKCFDTGFEIQCSCNDGYQLDVNGRTCSDIDECAFRRDNCRSDQQCVNSVGSFRCESRQNPASSCPTGFGYNTQTQLCQDIDECALRQDNCRSDQQCVNTRGNFRCETRQNPGSSCPTGYSLNTQSQQCEDINECALSLDTCTGGQLCENSVGSFFCRRSNPCGTGYTVDSFTQRCVDVDECAINTDNCREDYDCENIPGSFRCNRKSQTCPSGSVLNLRTQRCESVLCPRGMRTDSNGRCVDINECTDSNPCRSDQNCQNTHGSYRCTNRISCYEGFKPNAAGTFCEDIDECSLGTHNCDETGTPSQTCANNAGGFECQCPRGYTLNPSTNQCEDDNECTQYGAQVCSFNARCENVAGSYRCICNAGFTTAGDGHSCVDTNECQTPRLCQHTCINTYGSFECRCRAGHRLTADKRSCQDVDECAAGDDRSQLSPTGQFQLVRPCIGICQNTPGSFQCTCPQGYQMGASGRVCEDVDECSTRQAGCSGNSKVCVNTRGGYRCNEIQCPKYFTMTPRAPGQQNSIRCQRSTFVCKQGDEECITAPLSYSYNFLTFPSRIRVPADLFTMRGPTRQRLEFSLKLISQTRQATSLHFQLNQVNPHTALVRLVQPLTTPQDVELELHMSIYQEDNSFFGTAVAKIFIYVVKDPWEE